MRSGYPIVRLLRNVFPIRTAMLFCSYRSVPCRLTECRKKKAGRATGFFMACKEGLFDFGLFHETHFICLPFLFFESSLNFSV